MKNTDPKDDLLKSLFHRLPESDLPSAFRENMMQKIMKEAVRIKKRNERLTLFAIIIASLAMVSLAVLAFFYLEIPKVTISFSMPDLSGLPSVPFYVYIGILSLVLLFGDYKMRKQYREKHKK